MFGRVNSSTVDWRFSRHESCLGGCLQRQEVLSVRNNPLAFAFSEILLCTATSLHPASRLAALIHGTPGLVSMSPILSLGRMAQDPLPKEWCGHNGLGLSISIHLRKFLTEVCIGQPSANSFLLQIFVGHSELCQVDS